MTIRIERAYVDDVDSTTMSITMFRGGTIKIPKVPEWEKWEAVVVTIEPGRTKPVNVITLNEYNKLHEDVFDQGIEEECVLDPSFDDNDWWPNILALSWYKYLEEEERKSGECVLDPSFDELPY